MAENNPEVDDRQPSVRTLHVRIEGSDQFFDRVQERLDGIDSDEDVEATSDRGLSLPDEEALARVFSAQNLQLIRAVAEHQPSSMRDLAEIVDRDIKNVSVNLNELASLGLVDLVEDGRAKRPVVPYDEIEVVYSVRSPSEESVAHETSPADD